jgi:hypothetical protein
VVQQNQIGTRRDGLAALRNVIGIYVLGATKTIGGATATVGNVISGNQEAGVKIATAAAHGNVVEGNLIGVGSDGTTTVPNTPLPLSGRFGFGVWILLGASNNTIGDPTAAGNVIAFNTSVGVVVSDASSTGNAIRGNSIHDNGALGIDLGGNGVTLNDNQDADTGSNTLQNFPVVTSALLSGGMTSVTGVLDSTPSTTFTLDFYANRLPDPSGYGEGQTYLGSTTVATDPTGHASFTATVAAAPAGQQFLSATATDPGHNTSEFSPNTIISPSSLAGTAFEDFNNDSRMDFGEPAIAGVTITLTGTDDLDRPVSLSQQTGAGGAYLFANLLPGNYTLTETQPAGYTQGIDSVGTAGGSLVATDQFFVQLGQGVSGLDYNYGDRPAATGPIHDGQTAGIEF